MEQLPPNIPMTPLNWHQRSSGAPTPASVDEFLDFSAARRSAHRRSASDCITFLETAASSLLDVRRNGVHHEFDRLDDEQLMSMFSDHDAAAPQASSETSPPTSENCNSVDEDKKPARAIEIKAEGVVKNERCEEANSVPTTVAHAPAPEPATQPIVDPKRIKRILANRQSAQRSRVRKLQYILELERSVSSLQTEVSLLSPRVAFLDHQRSVLTVGNSALRQRIAALAQDRIFKDAHQDALKKEIERLRQMYNQQSLKNMPENTATAEVVRTATARAKSVDRSHHDNRSSTTQAT